MNLTEILADLREKQKNNPQYQKFMAAVEKAKAEQKKAGGEPE